MLVSQPDPFGSRSLNNSSPESSANQWKHKLFLLQESAPKPKLIRCLQKTLQARPAHYGEEYHGLISREETDRLLSSHSEGSYLVRSSSRGIGACTLCFLFDSQARNYKLFYDSSLQQHYVGEKKFDSIHDLVADGLITLFLDKYASDYIRQMADSTIYEESPYSHYLRAQRQARSQTQGKQKEPFPRNASRTSSVGSSNSEAPEPMKSHRFKVHTFKGANWCDFCGNFLWGLVQQGSKCEDCGFGAHRKCAEKALPDCIPDLKYVKRLFGVDLTTLTMLHHTAIPLVLEKCIREIESRGLSSEGLYRVPGFHEEIEHLRALFDSKGQVDLSRSSVEDVNTVAGLLKSYLRQLPLPLMPYSATKDLLERLPRCRTELERISLLRTVLKDIPPAHYSALKTLMCHLKKVASLQQKNRMSEENLALIFCPTVMRSLHALQGVSMPVGGGSLSQEQFIVYAMVKSFDRVFGEESESPKVNGRS